MASSSTHLARLRLALPPVLRPVLPLVLAWFGLSASLAGCEVIAGITDRRVGDGGAPEVAPMPDGANGAAGGSADATAGTGGVTPLGGAGGGGGSPDGGGGVDVVNMSRTAFTDISAAANHTCGVDTSGAIRCWGEPVGTPAPGAFVQVSTGDGFACGRRADGSLVCAGNNAFGQTLAPAGPFEDLTAGSAHACARRAGGGVACWGYNRYGQADTPSSNYSQVSAGGDRTCVLGFDGAVVCAGVDIPVPVSVVDKFTRISTGPIQGCGVRRDIGAISCWDRTGKDVPALTRDGVFLRVDTALSHVCAITAQKAVVCWGDDVLGRAVPPVGTFSEVTSGAAHVCALGVDHVVVCWGDDSLGQASPP